MTFDELIPDLPRPGWPGRRRAIVRGLFAAFVQAVLLLLIFAAFSGVLVMVAASTNAL